MNNSKQSIDETQGVEYWENQLLYFEDAMKGLKLSFSLVSDLHRHASQKLAELMPEREEVTE